MGVSRYIGAAAALVALTGALWGWWQYQRAGELSRSLIAAEARAVAAERASVVLTDHVRRIEAEAAKADDIRTAINEADHESDCPVPDWMSDTIRRLRTGTAPADRP